MEKERAPGPFYLDKWFLDLVSDDGSEAFIFYAARLRWHGIEVPYTSCLHFSSGKIAHRFRLSGIGIPTIQDRVITWADTRFGVDGQWRTMAHPLQERVYQSDAGYLDWHCHQPASEAHLRVHGRELSGQGYAEQLILTLPPWKLPIETLRWGRFIGGEQYIVWIEMDGPEPVHWLWLNGQPVQQAVISDNKIDLPDHGICLHLDRKTTLESEKKILEVVKSMLRFLPGLKRVMPTGFLLADEYKWLSRGKLFKDNEPVDTGWAIHEFVRFDGQKPLSISHTVKRHENI
ncbi:MAG: hypothetical protein EP344_11560 [Bacteroidetes bacterium]|nr:MAG: hypothetical protein EP344_11560 [Bacteroidota bacterium]